MQHQTRIFRLAGAGVALLTLMLDQASKAFLLGHVPLSAFPIDILPFFNIVLVHNRGISFGLFAHMQAWMPVILLLGTSLIVCILVRWLMQTSEKPIIFALGAIIGGAVGNIADRVRVGAVTDFLDFHLGAYHWPAFNLADSFIFMGVVLLVAVSIVHPSDTHVRKHPQ